MKHTRLITFLLMVLPVAVFAQAIDELLKGSASDAKYLAEGYATPMMRAFGYGMNAGWYNTAKPHNFPGFDLTFSVNPVFIPSSDKVFRVDNTKLQSVYLSQDVNGNTVTSTGSGDIPTFFGAKTNTTYTQKPPLPVNTFQGPQGANLGFLPLPTLNLGVGLPKGFEIKFRYVPTVDLSSASGNNINGSVGLFGIGIMHDFKQYIPVVKALPFDASVFVGYTKLDFNVDFDKANPDRKGQFTSTATTVQLLVSKKIAVLTGYMGVGYNMATTKLAVKGNYDLNGNGSSNDAGEKDPVNFSVDSTGPRATVGLRLKLAVLTLHGDYTFQKYNTVSAGIGISVR